LESDAEIEACTIARSAALTLTAAFSTKRQLKKKSLRERRLESRSVETWRRRNQYKPLPWVCKRQTSSHNGYGWSNGVWHRRSARKTDQAAGGMSLAPAGHEDREK
jgi:hypothetical protein